MTNTIEETNLPISILNYFAAFTETKFNFRTLINYRWTNNELTLDLSLFQKFQALLVNRVKCGDRTDIAVKKNEYILSLSKNDIQIEIQKILSNNFVTIQRKLQKRRKKT